MKKAILHQLQSAVTELYGQPKLSWISAVNGQVAAAVADIFWTAAVEEALYGNFPTDFKSIPSDYIKTAAIIKV